MQKSIIETSRSYDLSLRLTADISLAPESENPFPFKTISCKVLLTLSAFARAAAPRLEMLVNERSKISKPKSVMR